MDFQTNWMKLAQCLKRLKNKTESLWLIISILYILVSSKMIAIIANSCYLLSLLFRIKSHHKHKE